jgi:hypothetical protein
LFLAILLAGWAQSYNLYYGNLHSHTSYSDGQGTPRWAFAYARDTAHIQVLAVTDHSSMLNSQRWYDTRDQADSATRPGSFVGICGFEWTHADFGHINVLFTSRYVTQTAKNTLPKLYAWLDSQPEVIGQFNHPGSGDFDNFAYSLRGDSSMELCEMKTVTQSGRFYLALDSGWHLGASANQDNHQADWGMERDQTGIWADSLTRNSILQALRAHRTFATMDRNARVQFTVNGAWMGSIINNGDLHFRVIASDPDRNDRIVRVELVTNHNQILATHPVGDTNFVDWQTSTRTNSGEQHWFFARIVLNDSTWVVSSPVWTAGGAALADATPSWANGRLLVYPNPSHGIVTFRIPGSRLPVLEAALCIYDHQGRLIRRIGLPCPPLPAPYSLSWDGATDTGQQALPGVYFARLLTAAGTETAKLLIR